MMFDDIKDWYAFVKEVPRKTNSDSALVQVNALYKTLLLARTRTGIHDFEKARTMGLAISAIRRRAETLGFKEKGVLEFLDPNANAATDPDILALQRASAKLARLRGGLPVGPDPVQI